MASLAEQYKTDREMPIAIQLILAGKVSRALLDMEYNKIGLSFPYSRILTTLADHGPKTATELCMLTMRERASMSVLLAKMKKIGYVQDAPSLLDARTQIISLTDLGREAAEKCQQLTRQTGEVIERFVAQRTDDPEKIRAIISEFLNRFQTLQI